MMLPIFILLRHAALLVLNGARNKERKASVERNSNVSISNYEAYYVIFFSTLSLCKAQSIKNIHKNAIFFRWKALGKTLFIDGFNGLIFPSLLFFFISLLVLGLFVLFLMLFALPCLMWKSAIFYISVLKIFTIINFCYSFYIFLDDKKKQLWLLVKWMKIINRSIFIMIELMVVISRGCQGENYLIDENSNAE